MLKKITPVVSWLLVLWISKTFLLSLPYKFSGHPDTIHIFSTIGDWIGGVLGTGIGEMFSANGAVLVGTFELIISVILLAPFVLWILSKCKVIDKTYRSEAHQYGGLLASFVMSGAVFFHLFTPLGIEVLHQGKSDNGSLFFAACSIVIAGVVLFFLNKCQSKCA